MTTVARSDVDPARWPAGPTTRWPTAARRMREAESGSIIVADGRQGDRHPDRARPAAGGRGRRSTRPAEPVGLWMTANPDVLGPDEEVGAAWSSLSHHHYRHLPVVDGGALVGVVSIRDLFGHRPPASGRRERRTTCPGGSRGSSWPRPRSATSAASRASSTTGSTRPSSWPTQRSLEDVWYLLFEGALPDAAAVGRLRRARWRRSASSRPGSPRCCRPWPGRGHRSTCCAPRVSLLGAELGWPPTHDIDQADAGRPGPPAVRRGAHASSPPPTGSGRASSRCRPAPTWATRPTTCGCSPGPSPAATGPGASSST